MASEGKKVMRKLTGTLVILGLVTMLLTGCMSILKKPAAKKDPPPPKIAVLMATMKGDGYETIKKEMEKSKKQEKVELKWEDAKNDPQTQQKQVEKMLKQRVKAIVLDLVNPSVGGALVAKIAKEKVPVLALDKIPEGTEVAGVVVPDYLRAGELQGQFVGKSAKKGKVILLMGPEDAQPGKSLYQGFIQGLQAEGSTAKGIVVKKQVISDLVPDSQIETKVNSALKENPDAVAVVSQEPRQTLALVKFLTKQENKDKADKLLTVGLGADKTASVAVAAGKHDAEIDTRPDLLAYYTLKAAKELAGGQKLDFGQNIKNGDVDVPAKVVPVRLISLQNTWLLEERWGNLKKAAAKLEKQQDKSGKSGAGQGKSDGGKSKESGSGDQSKSSGGDTKGSGSDSQGSGKDSPGSGGDSKASGGQSKEAGKKSSGQQGPKTTLTIKTKEGKTMEIEVDGEIQEIKSQSKKEQNKASGTGKASGTQ